MTGGGCRGRWAALFAAVANQLGVHRVATDFIPDLDRAIRFGDGWLQFFPPADAAAVGADEPLCNVRYGDIDATFHFSDFTHHLAAGVVEITAHPVRAGQFLLSDDAFAGVLIRHFCQHRVLPWIELGARNFLCPDFDAAQREDGKQDGFHGTRRRVDQRFCPQGSR